MVTNRSMGDLSAAMVIRDADFIDELPPGFRFHPTDGEVIDHYLKRKVLQSSFNPRAIGEIDLNKCEPWDLPSKAKMGENEWYFYYKKDRKYPTGLRTNRATKAGYWKATGKDKGIHKSGKGNLIGMKKTLVFYKERAPKGIKTNWVMHEFRLEGKSSYSIPRTEKAEWVVCRIFHKNTDTVKKSDQSNQSTIRTTSSSPMGYNFDNFTFHNTVLPQQLIDSSPSNYPNTTITNNNQNDTAYNSCTDYSIPFSSSTSSTAIPIQNQQYLNTTFFAPYNNLSFINPQLTENNSSHHHLKYVSTPTTTYNIPTQIKPPSTPATSSTPTTKLTAVKQYTKECNEEQYLYQSTLIASPVTEIGSSQSYEDLQHIFTSHDTNIWAI